MTPEQQIELFSIVRQMAILMATNPMFHQGTTKEIIYRIGKLESDIDAQAQGEENTK